MITDTIQFDRKEFTDKQLIGLFTALVKPRLVEEKMLLLLRKGKISKWFSGIGQEAISVGVTSALNKDEYIFPLHRNLGVFTTRQIPLNRLFGQWQGKVSGFTKGRDRSFHFGAPDYHIIGMISHLGAQLSLADGVALAHQLKNENKIVAAFSGEGATSEGEFHEALNVAAVWDLPVLFVIENNGYGLSTPSREQFRCESIADKGIGYGIESLTIDGNDILEVYSTVTNLAQKMREKPAPFLLECNTFRMRGHEEASGTKYVPKSLMDYWKAKDPVKRYESFLLEKQIITQEEIESMTARINAEIDEHLKMANNEPPVYPTIDDEMADIYAPYENGTVLSKNPEKVELRFIDAISNALDLALAKHPNLIFMGQDIAEYGGVFKITAGLMEKYGKSRIRNTPLCESAIIGTAIGLSLNDHIAMVEMQFADFVSCGFNQIVNNLAKLNYRWAHAPNVVIRMPTGAGVGAGPFHSQSNEAWFTHVPGLKIVYPASVHDAKGLLLASFEDPNPVLYFEHKALYRSISAEIPNDYYTVPIGKARIERTGNSVSVITYGMGVKWAVDVTRELNIDAEIIDLRTLVPLDYDTIEKSIKKTNKVIILHEDTMFGGLGGEIAAHIIEHWFEFLDGPVMRAGSLDTPVPFAKELETQFLPHSRFKEKLKKLLAY